MKPTPGMHKTFLEFHKAFDHRMIAWKQEVLFTWQWWLGIFLTIIPWVLWLVFRKRNSKDRLLFAGLFVILVSLTMDNVGVQLSLWNYPRPVIPAIQSSITSDFSLMPVCIMFLIQLFPSRNPWLIGFIFGVLSSFVGEPIFKWLGIYEQTNWRSIYSLPLYTVIYYFAHRMTLRNSFEKLE